MKKLIVNADDMGLTRDMNEAIALCLDAGKITGVSLISAGKYFDEAVVILKHSNFNEVGVHLALTGEVEVLSREGSRLISKNYKDLAGKYILGKCSSNDIKKEWDAQIKKTVGIGFKITHLDSHEHVHLFPGAFNAVCQLADKYGIKYVRVPYEPPVVMSKNFNLKDFVRFMSMRTAIYLSVMKIKKLKNANDYFLGHFHAERISKDIFEYLLSSTPQGVTEIAFHPSKERKTELDALLNYDWKKITEKKGIQIIKHSEL